MASPGKDGPDHSLIPSSSSSSITITPPNIHNEPPYSFFPPIPKLWLIDDHYTNYVVWRAHVHDQFNRDGMFGFIYGTETHAPSKTVLNNNEDGACSVSMDNPDYHIWIMSDQRAKETLLSLVDQDLVPADHQHKTCRDIWVELQDRFEPLVRKEASRSNKAVVAAAGEMGEYKKLYKAALSGDEWAAGQLFLNDVGQLVRNNIIATPICDDGSLPAAASLLAAAAIGNHDDNTVHGGSIFPPHTNLIYAKCVHMLRGYAHGVQTAEKRTPFYNTAMLGLLICDIDAGHFEEAWFGARTSSHLVGLKVSNRTVMTILASNPTMFGSTQQRIRNQCFPKVVPFNGVEAILQLLEPLYECLGGSENLRIAVIQICGLLVFVSCCIPLIVLNTLYWLPWKFLKTLGFVDKKSGEMPKNDDALELLGDLCNIMKTLPGTAKENFGEPFLVAARSGANVVIKEILNYFPEAAALWDPVSSQYIFHMAVKSRNAELFAMIYKELRRDNFAYLHIPDDYGDNLLHLAAKLSPPDVLDKIPGSVLQIQHEIKWFKEIEKLMEPNHQVRRNRDGKTPKMIFIEEHKELKDTAEKWMKDTATSCTVIAALISTIMFAAAITVPGGNLDTGLPMFTRNSIFTLFAISDAISFITSVIALLMFMEIMMSRYEIGEFMRQLPVRLFIGLTNLFLSIFFMMLSFSVTVYLVFGQPRHWVLISVVTLTCYVVLLFGYLQGSLLFEFIGSTYSGGFIPDHQTEIPSESEPSLSEV